MRLVACSVVPSARPEENPARKAWGRVESQVLVTPSISRSGLLLRSRSKRKSKILLRAKRSFRMATSASVALESSPERTSFPGTTVRPSCILRPPISRAFSMPSKAMVRSLGAVSGLLVQAPSIRRLIPARQSQNWVVLFMLFRFNMAKVRKKQAKPPVFFVPPLGIEKGPTEPESVILSFKLQGHPVKGLQI